MISKRVISIHFPKAAGTSLRTQFEKSIGSGLMLDYDHAPLGDNIHEPPDAVPDNIKIIHGHFRADRYDTENSAVRVTILRHPVENLVSIYFFWMSFASVGNPIHDRFLDERPSIEQFAQYPGIGNLMSEGYFGGFDMDRMDFVGFHEKRNTDIPRLGVFLDLPLSAEVYENRTISTDDLKRKQLMQDKAMMARISDALKEDVAFYEAQYERWG